MPSQLATNQPSSINAQNQQTYDTQTQNALASLLAQNAPATAKTNATQAASDLGMENLYNQTSGQGALATLAAQRSPQTNAIISQAMAQSGGLSSNENGALRSAELSTVNGQNQSALSALRGSQASNGVRGGLAGAQMGQQNNQAAGSLATSEQNLVNTNLQSRQQGLQSAADIVGNQENVERDEAADQLSTVMAGRGAQTYLQGAQLQAAANNSANNGGKGK